MADKTINELTILENGERYNKKKYEGKYPAGKVLYLLESDCGESQVIAFTEYVRYYNEADYLEIYKRNAMDSCDVSVKVIEPGPYYLVGNKWPEKYDSYEEFVEHVVPAVADQFEDFTRNYNINKETITVYFTINNGEFTYWGLGNSHEAVKIIKEVYEPEIISRLEATRFLDDERRDRIIKNYIEEKYPDQVKQEYMLYRDSLKNRLKDYSYEEFRDDMRKRVKGQPELDKVCLAVYHYLILKANKMPVKERCNTIISAPSGCGKTETYRAIKELFEERLPEIEVMICNTSSFSSAGYKGENITEFIGRLAERCENKEGAIIFLDELDKKLKPDIGSNGYDYNGAVQNEMLTMIEGHKYGEFDTTDILFVGIGSFAECRKKREHVCNSIGFNGCFEKEADHYDDITIEDIIDSGATYELMGRFSQVVNYHKLSKEIVFEIAEEYAESFCKVIEADKIILTDQFKEELYESANGPMGVRVVKNEIKKSVMLAFEEYALTGNKSMKSIVLKKDGFEIQAKMHVSR